jgi:hypothetical protein
MKKSFLKKVIDSRDTASSKRLITLIIALHFVIASFAILFLVCYIALTVPKGVVDNVLLSSLEKILQYDFYIILAGLGFITSEGLVQILINRGLPGPVQPPPDHVEPLENQQII